MVQSRVFQPKQRHDGATRPRAIRRRATCCRPPGTNNANFSVYNGGYVYTDPTNHLTPVGAFAGSPSPFGMYDMGGDVFQWNEANISNVYRGMRGGYWGDGSGDMESSDSDSDNPLAASSVWGFRVASVPEPSTIVLLLAGAACLLGFAWRRRTMRNRTLMVVALAGVLTMTASVSQAQVSNVFNMPNGEASLQFVTVGSPGTLPTTSELQVSGDVRFRPVRLSDRQIRCDDWRNMCQFLNAVAATDTYGLV